MICLGESVSGRHTALPISSNRDAFQAEKSFLGNETVFIRLERPPSGYLEVESEARLDSAAESVRSMSSSV